MASQRQSVYLRRRAAALASLAACVGGVTLAAGAVLGDEEPARTAAEPPARKDRPPPQLPGGGRRIFPDRRVVAFYGSPDDRQLGVLGIGTPERAGRRLLRQAKSYVRKTRPVLPAFELLSTIANAHPGMDGLYRRHASNSTIRRYLKAARKIDALLVLDIQPGRADFLTETKRLKRWLSEPDVGLALDPEWRVVAGQVPGKVIGSVAAVEVNAVSAWLDDLVTRRRLPQKLFVLHQFTSDMIRDKATLADRPGLATVLNADGFGGRAVKEAKYHHFVSSPPRFNDGFKLFYEEDVGLMKPRQVLRLRPPPDFVVYE